MKHTDWILATTSRPTMSAWAKVLVATKDRFTWTESFFGTSPNGFSSFMWVLTQTKYLNIKNSCCVKSSFPPPRQLLIRPPNHLIVGCQPKVWLLSLRGNSDSRLMNFDPQQNVQQKPPKYAQTTENWLTCHRIYIEHSAQWTSAGRGSWRSNPWHLLNQVSRGNNTLPDR